MVSFIKLFLGVNIVLNALNVSVYDSKINPLSKFSHLHTRDQKIDAGGSQVTCLR